MTFFILAFALLNVGLGYALAVYLGHHLECPLVTRMRLGQAAPEPEPVDSRNIAQPPARPEQVNVRDLASIASTEDTIGLVASIEKFKEHLEDYRRRVTVFERSTQQMGDYPNIDAQSHINNLADAGEHYIQCQSSCLRHFKKICGSAQPFAEEIVSLEEAIAGHASEVGSLNSTLQLSAMQSDLADVCRRITDQTSKLEDTHERLRDTLDEAIWQARHGTEPGAGALVDSMGATRLISRRGLQAELEQRWKCDPQRSQPLSLGMIEIDHFGKYRDQHGMQLSDRVFEVLTATVTDLLSNEDRATRFAGKRILLMMPATTQDATNCLECIRQTFEAIIFEREGHTFSATVSCALAEAIPADTLQTALDRVAKTLREAQRYGGNTTFSHDSHHSAPVIPPQQSITSRVIKL